MRVRNRLGLTAAAGLAALALGATACQSGSSGPSSASGSSSAPDAAAGGGGSQRLDGTAALNVATSRKLGSIVTDGQGRTLYRFDKDTAKPPASHCAGDCAATWPPVTTRGEVELRGLDKSLVGTVRRADGVNQLTLGGWPLYRFARDERPGDTKGQGVGGTWYVSGPEGKKAKTRAAGTAGTAATAGTAGTAERGGGGDGDGGDGHGSGSGSDGGGYDDGTGRYGSGGSGGGSYGDGGYGY